MGLSSGNGDIDWDFKMPANARVSNDKMEKHMAIAAKDWADQRWEAFGEDVGKLLQEMALTVFDKKYSLDSSGMLGRNLQQPVLRVRSASPVAMYLGFAMVSAVVSLIASRRISMRVHPREADFSHFAEEEEAIE